MSATGKNPEFPDGASVWTDPVSRRQFLELMTASLALAGVGGCTWFPPEHAIPYVNAPEDVIPGKPLFYATSFSLGGFARGVLAETHMARPTKIEGNPDHPASLGGCDVFMQGTLLDLYHPARGKTPTRAGSAVSWEDFYADLALDRFPAWDRDGGRGLRIVTQTVTSPALISLLQEFLARYPQARWICYEPLNRDQAVAGARLAFGRALSPIYASDHADVIVSLGGDFLVNGPASVRYALDFANGRRLRQGAPFTMNRLYVAESNLSVTGAMAEYRLAVRPSRVGVVAQALAMRLGFRSASKAESAALSPEESGWLDGAVSDLLAARGRAVVVVGDDQPDVTHALGHWINARLGATGSTVRLIDCVEAQPGNQLRGLAGLAEEMRAGAVDSLFLLGTDLARNAPAELDFKTLIGRVPHRYCYDTFPTESAFLCDWYLPRAHELESWGDGRAFDGTLTFQQPTVAPLYHGKAPIELLATLLKRPDVSGEDLLKDYWRREWPKPPKSEGRAQPEENFDSFWNRVLRDGLIRGSGTQAVDPRGLHVREDFKIPAASSPEPEAAALEISFEPDSRIWDGRFEHNGWLQELPKPLTQLTWDNAALLGPDTARGLAVANEDVVRLELDGRSVEAPILIVPGHAEGAVSVQLGYGRKHGFDAYALRTSRAFWAAPNLALTRTGTTRPLALGQVQPDAAGREIIVRGTLDRFRSDPAALFPEPAKTGTGPQPNLFPQFTYKYEAWAMVIDLTVCIGCQVCTIACQAENNIPVVGKDQVRIRRQMHWIRVDRYFYSDPESTPGNTPGNVKVAFQPMPCMHCERAPCEYVCPVEATIHGSTGLNEMLYNRCVGTRDCSNNCPYKVRRFNFLQFSEMHDPLKTLVYNPDVTVRERGVMEKCTYCIQRISAAQIAADKENRRIRPGEVVPACAQACPTRAIVFGDKNNPADEVARLKLNPLNYSLLAEQGTIPRTSYLARMTNPRTEGA